MKSNSVTCYKFVLKDVEHLRNKKIVFKGHYNNIETEIKVFSSMYFFDKLIKSIRKEYDISELMAWHQNNELGQFNLQTIYNFEIDLCLKQNLKLSETDQGNGKKKHFKKYSNNEYVLRNISNKSMSRNKSNLILLGSSEVNDNNAISLEDIYDIIRLSYDKFKRLSELGFEEKVARSEAGLADNIVWELAKILTK